MVRFQGFFASHSSHCFGGFFPQYSAVSPGISGESILSSGDSILSSVENSSRIAPNDHLTPTKRKQDKHKLLGPDFPRTFLTLALGCPGVKKHLQEDKLLVPTIFGADVQNPKGS